MILIKIFKWRNKWLKKKRNLGTHLRLMVPEPLSLIRVPKVFILKQNLT
jgi:hypothetical protein